MNTDTLVHRPPYDMNCPVLQVTRGCSHGKCRFCDIQEGKSFSVVPFEEIVEDIEEIAKTATQLTKRIYLAGGNPFVLPNDHLVKIFDAIEERIPTVNSYGGFARITDFKSKTDEELAQLAARGVTDITIGAESGWDELLEFMEKGQTGADLIEQGKRLHDAGIRYTFFYLAGLAGAGKGQQNALESARAFSEAAPDRILVVSDGQIVKEGTPREIFRQVDALRELHLDVPPMTALSAQLREAGMPLPDGVLTVEEMAEEVAKLLCPSK